MRVKGLLKIEIDELGIEANVTLTPDPSGAELSEEVILRHLTEARVREGIDRLAIARAFRELAQQPRQFVRFTAARGLPPEDPQDGGVEWIVKDVPPHLAKEAAKAFGAAASPRVGRLVAEKVRVEKEVAAPSKIKFLGARREKTIVVETRWKIEPVSVDETILDTGFASAGDRVARVIPGSPGKAGRSIFGRTIAPRESVEVLVGERILRKEEDYLSQSSGFFRRGENWIEILPFLGQPWNVSLSKDGMTVQIDYTPTEDGKAPDMDLVLDAIKALEVEPSSLIPATMIREALEGAARDRKPLKAFSLSRRQNAEVSLYVAPDAMLATLNIKKGRGDGTPLNLKEVAEILRTSGLKSIDLERVQRDVLDFYRSRKSVLENYELARGRSPGAAPTRRFRILVDLLSDEKRQPIINLLKENADKIPSFKTTPLDENASFARVKPGQAIANLGAAQRGDPGRDVYGKPIPGPPGNEPAVRLLENARREGDAFVSTIDGYAEFASRIDFTSLRVHPWVLPEISVEIAMDKMSATLTLLPAFGFAQPFSLERVKAVLYEERVRKGVDEADLARMVERHRAGEPVENEIVAVGKHSEAGSQEPIRFFKTLASGRSLTLREDGTADFRSQDRMTPVRAGELIAEMVPPSRRTGSDGYDVMGVTIPARAGGDRPIEIGENVRKEPKEDVVYLYAVKSGNIVFEKRKLSVREICSLPGDVDMKTGNIRFPGDVYVKGFVRTGFFIVAGKSISVDSGVEAALLSAEEGIRIRKGVVGGQKAVLRSKQDIQIGFAEQAILLAVGDIRVRNACYKSMIKCNGRVVLEGDNGRLVGGKTQARKGIETLTLGAPGGARTDVSFGQDYLIGDQIEKEDREIKKARDRIDEIDGIMKTYEKEGRRDNLNDMRQEKLTLLKTADQRSLRVFTLREKFETHFPAEIVVKGTLYPGVVFESHGRYFEVEKEYHRVKVVFMKESGRIEVFPWLPSHSNR